MSYVFQAYPMRITAPDGKRIRVFSQQEHDELVAGWTPATTPVADEPAPVAVQPAPSADLPESSAEEVAPVAEPVIDAAPAEPVI